MSETTIIIKSYGQAVFSALTLTLWKGLSVTYNDGGGFAHCLVQAGRHRMSARSLAEVELARPHGRPLTSTEGLGVVKSRDPLNPEFFMKWTV